MIWLLMVYLILPIPLVELDTRPVVHIPKDLSDFMTKTAFNCMIKLQTSSIMVKRFFEFQLPDNEASKKFLYCVSYETYLADEDGHMSEALLRLFDGSEHAEEVQKVFESCNKIKTKSPVRTIFEVANCFYKNSPVVLGPDLVRY
ncbi:PREDICTED: uncharacterized protein LOC106100313 [Papilio polytes]|uniref:uncharacterized protein LOC106100313 n=1 Tax=Papilio polytes TaxID=76194 RepID=UPI0006762A89|nr:PREDICTED: uncharacterized protein LOC106100313 [Papilio polytes]